MHFNTGKEAEGYNWETVKTNYDSLAEFFVNSYPQESI